MPVKNPKVLAGSILIFVMITTLVVVPVVLWAVTKPKTNPKTSCSSDTDCNNNGVCVNSACKCNSPWGGPFCSVLGNLTLAQVQGATGVNCSQVPTVCKSDTDCADSCAQQDTTFTCQTVTSTQNAKGLSGTFCLPAQPASACLTGVSTADSIPGFYTWQGWADVETQAWTCDCEFPNFYPSSTVSTGSGPVTACTKSPQVCQHGDWTYPCLRDPSNPLVCLNAECSTDTDCTDPNQKCLPITENKKVCQLPPVPCNTVSDCPGCGTSEYDPTKYTPDQITGLCGTKCVKNNTTPKTCQVDANCDAPSTCVNGTCTSSAPVGTCQKVCKINSDCGSFPCVNGVCVTSPATLVGSNPFQFGKCDCQNQSCSTDENCAGTCLNGTCVNQRVAMGPQGTPTCVPDTCAPGGTFQLLQVAPYTYGYCECSDGYTAQGNTCVYTGNSPPTKYCALGCGRGTCVAAGICSCPTGWKGNSICTKFSCDKQTKGCGNGTCVAPNTCACDVGYSVDENGACTKLNCPQGCLNGTCTLENQEPTCVCKPGYTGADCSKPISVTCPTITRGTPSDTEGACVSLDSKTCTYENPLACTGAYFGTSSSYQGSAECGGNCSQGYKTPNVAGIPELLCSNGSAAVPCTADTCSNQPIEVNNCLQNDLYSYNCTELCSAATTFQTYDYNTICKKQTPPTKPTWCP
jgi:hypothetical protein